jgi:hypothetical protein
VTRLKSEVSVLSSLRESYHAYRGPFDLAPAGFGLFDDADDLGFGEAGLSQG